MTPRRPVVRFGVDRPGRDALAVVGVHGRGQTPEVIRDIADRLDGDGLAWFAPHAPGDTWYPQSFLAPFDDNRSDLGESIADITALLGQLAREGWPADRIVVLGFSQGACLLAQTLLTAPTRICAGAVLFTGGYVGPPGTTAPTGTPWGGLPVVCSLVDRDPWVPLFRARETADAFRERGATVDFRVYPGDAHEVNDDEIAAAATLLHRVRS